MQAAVANTVGGIGVQPALLLPLQAHLLLQNMNKALKRLVLYAGEAYLYVPAAVGYREAWTMPAYTVINRLWPPMNTNTNNNWPVSMGWQRLLYSAALHTSWRYGQCVASDAIGGPSSGCRHTLGTIVRDA